eukprot:847626-Alexandrium_andersonii.AAC.1
MRPSPIAGAASPNPRHFAISSGGVHFMTIYAACATSTRPWRTRWRCAWAGHLLRLRRAGPARPSS